MTDNNPKASPLPLKTTKSVVPPKEGEVITSLATGNTYTMGGIIGEGSFGVVYACSDVWQNELAAKVFKPIGTYEKVKQTAESELAKLLTLRNPFITFVYDAFEFRDTFYIITERCASSIEPIFQLENFNGLAWLMPIARCVLQAVHYLHINSYVHQDIHIGNVFASLVKNELLPEQAKALQFKLGDLGVAKLFGEVNATNTRAQWMLPPEVLDPKEYGPIDHRLDIYHLGLLFLKLACSKQLRFRQEEILKGRPREIALSLASPLNFALEKCLRRRVSYRTSNAMEIWRDLHTPSVHANQVLKLKE